jgi:hypothetical protein
MPTARPTELNLGTSDSVPLATYNSEVLQSAKYQQESLAGTGVDPIAGAEWPTGQHNFLVNGGFDDWRGVPIGGTGYNQALDSAGVATPGPNGWGFQHGGVNNTYGGENQNGGSVFFTAYLDATGAPDTLYQSCYQVGELRGKVVTFSIRQQGGNITLTVGDDTGAGATSQVQDATDWRWRTHSVSYTVAATATRVTCAITMPNTPNTVPGVSANIDCAQLTATPAPVGYKVENPWLAAIKNEQRFEIRQFSVRFRALGAGHIEYLYLPFRTTLPTSLVPAASGASVAGLALPNATPASGLIQIAIPSNVTNIDWANSGIVDWDANGANIKMAATAAGDAWAINAYLIAQNWPTF